MLQSKVFLASLVLLVMLIATTVTAQEATLDSIKRDYPNAVLQMGSAKSLVSIKLSQASLKNDGFHLFSSHADLEEISLDRCAFDEAQLKELIPLKKLKRVRLNGSPLSDSGLKTICGILSIELLDLGDCQRITDQGLESLVELTRLRNLTIGSRQVTDKGLLTLSKLANLGALSFQDCAIDGAGFVHLKTLVKLKEFGLFKSNAGDKAIDSLIVCKEMTKLKLRASGVTSQGIQEHIASFPKLVSLDLGETSIDDDALAAIAKTGVEDLNLLRTSTTNAGVAMLLPLKLKRLNLDDIRGIDDQVFDSLIQMESLEFLHLGKTKVTDTGIARLAVLSKLKDLLINDTLVTEEATSKLQQAIKDLKVKR